ncbi:hypothetical protein B0T13DRAFT_211469 [Neurospora crassa]|nr:hypothetical protein B0T13DRAFT_211469 [Neurospora crassa]
MARRLGLLGFLERYTIYMVRRVLALCFSDVSPKLFEAVSFTQVIIPYFLLFFFLLLRLALFFSFTRRVFTSNCGITKVWAFLLLFLFFIRRD